MQKISLGRTKSPCYHLNSEKAPHSADTAVSILYNGRSPMPLTKTRVYSADSSKRGSETVRCRLAPTACSLKTPSNLLFLFIAFRIQFLSILT